jgi:monoterpene epsilon-lactone hydrolase
MSLSGFLKKLFLFVLIVAVAIPLRYGSTNRRYLIVRLLHSTLSLKHTLLPDPARPTLSADYRAFEEILRKRPVEEHDPLADPLSSIKEKRSTFALSNIVPKPSECQVNKEVFHHDGHSVDAYWVDHSMKKFKKTSDKLLVYLHGGGYVIGDIYGELFDTFRYSISSFLYIMTGYSGFECHLSQLFNVTILHLEYRLSPEHPLPGAVEDTIAIYRALIRDGISPSQLIIMGDSAGGGLSLLTIQALIARQLPVPRSVITLSPWADLSISSESYTRNRLTDIFLKSDIMKWMVELIMGTNHSQLSSASPVVSPLFGSFEGFPPMYINVGTAEILEDDSRRVFKKAQEAGVDVTFEEGVHLMHVYPIFYSYYPEARNTLDNINKWIQFHQKSNE